MIKINVLDILKRCEERLDTCNKVVEYLQSKERERGYLTRCEELELADMQGRVDERKVMIKFIEDNMGD